MFVAPPIAWTTTPDSTRSIPRRWASTSTAAASLSPSTSTTARTGSAEGRMPGDRLAQDQRVHLDGPLVGEHRLEVVHVPDHGVLQRDAVGAEDGARRTADLEGLAHVVELADADLLRSQQPLVLEPPEVQREEHALGELDRHVGELLLGELEPTDRAAELLA